VFIHNLVGGLDRNSRGGVEAASLYEWGGHDLVGSYVFDDRRPDWHTPIHELLVQNHVTIVFHGHDHLFARQTLDGVIYQCVPQPGLEGAGESQRATEYGYISGDIVDGAGYMRINVSGNSVTVDFMKMNPSSAETSNPETTFSYVIGLTH
jgi:hypothetical protein